MKIEEGTEVIGEGGKEKHRVGSCNSEHKVLIPL